jgi:hypothetical protein
MANPRGVAALALLCALSACTKAVPIHVSPRALHEARDEFKTKGRARVQINEGGTIGLSIKRRFEVHLEPAGPGSEGVEPSTETLSIGALLENCPGVLPFRGGALRRSPPCLLLDVAGSNLPVGERREYDPHRTRVNVLGAAILSVGIGGWVCVAKCDAPLSVISVPTAILSTFIGGFLFVYPKN